VRLLFDHNLSPRLVARLSDAFPGASHVSVHGLDRADDPDVWEFARDQGFTVVTKDTDFRDLATLRGAPPKIVWLRLGNCTTGQIENLLRHHQTATDEFDADLSAAILALV
jgi:predicted nuclease of predicted toxin-antitoxin system